MSMSFGFGGGLDPGLSSKIDQMLAGRTSAQQRVEEFLVDEMHVDPSKIPLSFKDARAQINQKLGNKSAQSMRFEGNSMGLAYVEFYEEQETEPSACGNCGQGSYFYRKDNGKWECEDCDTDFSWNPPPAKVTRLVERDSADEWAELTRIYTALGKNVEPEVDGDAPDCDDCGASNAGSRRAPHLCETCEKKNKPHRAPAFTKFIARSHYYQDALVEGVKDPKIKWKKPARYPTGTRLRVLDGSGESTYVRIGGLFSDTDVVNLATMKPIEKVSALTVVEVLDDE